MLEQVVEKVRALRTLLVAIEKQFGKGAVMTLSEDEEPEPVAAISTGSLALDLATGIGGIPRGRVVEVYGPESSGKTTLALHAIAEAQRNGGAAAFIDAEHALDVAYARGVGVETDKLLISQPDTGEQALDITEMLVRSGAIDLVVIDSVAALTPKAELEGEMGDAHMGLQARLMSQALRKLTAAAYRSGTTLMFLNQLRQKIGVTFGSPETTTGGNALKFYASMRFDVRRIGQVKVGDEPVGGRTRVKIAKNKCEATQCLRIGCSGLAAPRCGILRRGQVELVPACIGTRPPGDAEIGWQTSISPPQPTAPRNATSAPDLGPSSRLRRAATTRGTGARARGPPSLTTRWRRSRAPRTRTLASWQGSATI